MSRWSTIPLLLLAGACTSDPRAFHGKRLFEPDPRDTLWEDFHVGVNVPWRSYGNDFGDNAWAVGGIEDHAEAIDRVFARLDDADVRVARWFVLTDGRAGIDFDAAGMPIEVQEDALADLVLMLDLAYDHGIFVVPVLLDFPWCAPALEDGGVQMGGHCGLLADEMGRDALVEQVVRPVVAEVGDHPAVLAWDLINEPEWATVELGGGWLGDGVPAADLLEFTRAATVVVREETEQRVTVGSASTAMGSALWAGEDLDFVQVHSYDGAAQTTEADHVAAGAPVVVGEVGTSVEYGLLTDNLDALHARGYHGVWPWSLQADDDASALDLDTLAGWSSPEVSERRSRPISEVRPTR